MATPQNKGEAQALLDKDAKAKQFYKNANYMSASGELLQGWARYHALQNISVRIQHFKPCLRS